MPTDTEQQKPTESERRITRVVDRGMQMIVSMANNGRAHRQASGTVSDLKIGICVDVISNFRDLYQKALRELNKSTDHETKRAYFKVAHHSLEAITEAVEVMPDIDGTPPLPASPVPTEDKAVKKRRQFSAAEPVDQTQVPVRLTNITINNHARNGRAIKPVDGTSQTIDGE